MISSAACHASSTVNVPLSMNVIAMAPRVASGSAKPIRKRCLCVRSKLSSIRWLLMPRVAWLKAGSVLC